MAEVIDIEVCEKCKDHQWCTHHDEKKYIECFNQVKGFLSNYTVVKNKGGKVTPRRGAFEITYQDKLIFSKIQQGMFPAPNKVKEMVDFFMADLKEGKDVSQYSKL